MKKAGLFVCTAVLLLSGCGGVKQAQTDGASAQKIAEELGKTDWQAVSTDAGTFHLDGGSQSADFQYVQQHTDTAPLDELVAFALVSDALSEGAYDELRSRFLQSPHTVLAYLVLMGEQPAVLYDAEKSAAEVVCEQIAAADAAGHGGTEEFRQVMDACKADYPDGPVAALLDTMDAAHQASLERNQ